MTPHMFDRDLAQNGANHAPLSPLSFLQRSAEVHPHRLAIVHGALRQTWAQTYARCRQLASALRRHGIGKNDTVAVMLPNTPPMVEAHFGVPMAGAVLKALHTRVHPGTVAFTPDPGEALPRALTLRWGTAASGDALSISSVAPSGKGTALPATHGQGLPAT